MNPCSLRSETPMSAREFGQFRSFIYDAAGISLPDNKAAMVGGRLARRLAAFDLESFGDYYAMLASGAARDEVQMAIDLLTTNETYFFREPKHFEFLRAQALSAKGNFRVWSAACSSGEEAYSIAMTLDDMRAERPWELVASDISARALAKARAGCYPMTRLELLAPAYRKRYCLRGYGAAEGSLLVTKELRQRIAFCQMNLNAPMQRQAPFDLIFLRNVLIYFSPETKKAVLARVLAQLKPGGHLLIGHSDCVHGATDALEALAPAIYRKR